MVSRSFQYVAKEEGFLLVFHGIMSNTLAWLHHLPDCRLKYTGRIQLILQNINSDSKKKKKRIQLITVSLFAMEKKCFSYLVT
jgi:hypothetical protein